MVFVISYFPHEGSVCSWCRVWILPGPLVGLPRPQTYLLVMMFSWVEGSDPHSTIISLFTLPYQDSWLLGPPLSMHSSQCSGGLTISCQFHSTLNKIQCLLWPADSVALSHGFTFLECFLPSSPLSFPSPSSSPWHQPLSWFYYSVGSSIPPPCKTASQSSYGDNLGAFGTPFAFLLPYLKIWVGRVLSVSTKTA